MAIRHYVPAFTVRRPDGAERAVCGLFVYDEERLHVNEPSECWGCQQWLSQLAHPPAEVVGRITPETPWGVAL